jgi:hypothetical protein
MFNWTDERVDLASKFWTTTTMSASQIALELGGVTRNAVIGKMNRLGLCQPKQSAKPKSVRVRRNGVRVFQPRSRSFTPKVTPMPVEPLNIPLVDLEPHHCREVVSQDGFIGLFCGRDKYGTSSYCYHHHLINEYPAPAKARVYIRVPGRAA